MPTTRSLRAGGYEDKSSKEHLCYVCGQIVEGLAQRDTPTPKAARLGIELGERHRTCKPSDDSGETKKVYLSGRVAVG